MNETSWNKFSSITVERQWPGVDSVYRLIVLAALRNKQLTRGATPRIEANSLRRRNTSIALEEVKRGLVPFTNTGVQEKGETLIENGRRRCSALISFLKNLFAAETSRLALSMNSIVCPSLSTAR